MKAKNKITVKGVDVLYLKKELGEFVSLTDIARYKNPQESDDIIKNWLRNRNTIELLGYWETLHNPGFNPVEFDGIRNESGANAFTMTVKKWVESTNAVGIHSRPGRYGGTFAHKISRLNLHRGFPSNSNYTLSRSFSA